ncbi:hypothetical protein HanIR_Chr11g0543961 [Helianthus annuus]|nr:hypothetical protein HanIR_Chr11g0543961 [Helianthus annuus]
MVQKNREKFEIIFRENLRINHIFVHTLRLITCSITCSQQKIDYHIDKLKLSQIKHSRVCILLLLRKSSNFMLGKTFRSG